MTSDENPHPTKDTSPKSLIVATDILPLAEDGPRLSSSLSSGLRSISSWLPSSWNAPSYLSSPPAATSPMRVLRIQRPSVTETLVVVADTSDVCVWEVTPHSPPIRRLACAQPNCVDALICTGRVCMLTSARDSCIGNKLTCVTNPGQPTARQQSVTLDTPALGLSTMQNYLLIHHALTMCVYLCDSLEQLCVLECVTPLVATSQRWLAFEVPPPRESRLSAVPASLLSPARTPMHSYDVSDTARNIVAGIVSFGKVAQRQLSPMLATNSPIPNPYSSSESLSSCIDSDMPASGTSASARARSLSEGFIGSNRGWVRVLDLVASFVHTHRLLSRAQSSVQQNRRSTTPRIKDLCVFRACAEALTAFAFSPTGTMLACAPESGQVVYVYSLLAASPWCAYRLIRGFTTSTVCEISFCPSEARVCVCSLRGTGHVFNLSHTHAQTHAIAHTYTHTSVDKLLSEDRSREISQTQTLQSCVRVRLPICNTIVDTTVCEEPEEARRPPVYTYAQVPAHFRAQHSMSLISSHTLVAITLDGRLSHFHIHPQNHASAYQSPGATQKSESVLESPQAKEESEAAEQSVKVSETHRWDLRSPAPHKEPNGNSQPRSRSAPRKHTVELYDWLKHTYSHTQDPPSVPLWLRPPVRLKIPLKDHMSSSTVNPKPTPDSFVEAGLCKLLFCDQVSTSDVSVRRPGPIPLQPSCQQDQEMGMPSASTVSDRELQDSISLAMVTRIHSREDFGSISTDTHATQIFDDTVLQHTTENYFGLPVPSTGSFSYLDSNPSSNPNPSSWEGIFILDDQEDLQSQVHAHSHIKPQAIDRPADDLLVQPLNSSPDDITAIVSPPDLTSRLHVYADHKSTSGWDDETFAQLDYLTSIPTPAPKSKRQANPKTKKPGKSSNVHTNNIRY